MNDEEQKKLPLARRPLGFERIGYVVRDGELKAVDAIAQDDFAKRLLELSKRLNNVKRVPEPA